MTDILPHDCLLCGNAVPSEAPYHETCWPEAKRLLDGAIGIWRRMFGNGFRIVIRDAVPVPLVEYLLEPLPMLGDDVVAGPPPVPEDEDDVGLEKPCLCETDVDGRCKKCIDTICLYVRKLTELQAEFAEKQAALPTVDDVCDPCATRYADFSMARIVREMFIPILEKAGKAFNAPIMALAQSMKDHFMRKGVRRWPLFEKAMQELEDRVEPDGGP